MKKYLLPLFFSCLLLPTALRLPLCKGRLCVLYNLASFYVGNDFFDMLYRS